MNTKLQELTDKIYLEGVERGNAEAEEIIQKAQNEADSLLAKAHQDAENILQKAKQQSEELMKNTESEMKLYAQQAVNALKTEVTDLVNGSITESSVKAATADKDFMQKIILAMVQEIAKNEVVTIETKQAKELEAYFMANAKALLDKGVTIKEVNNIKTDFSIVPGEGGYKINFSEDEFVAYFKGFLRPKLIEMLF